MHKTPTLTAKNLSYRYQEAGKTVTVLDDVSFHMDKGERIALLGESGSGKSTLLNLLACIDKPESGQIIINQTLMNALKEPHLTLFRRQHIGFIYQLFNLIPTLTVAENIALPLELSGVIKQERDKKVADWLSKVGLANRGQAFPDQLSGGEQQRVAVARALIHQPAIVLADEPTGNLDAQTGHKILDLLISLAQEQQQTLLMVTHSKIVAEVSDRSLVLESGKLKQGGVAKAW